jgi:acyl-CoA hydrolase
LFVGNDFFGKEAAKIMETITRHHIRPEHLNHHGTLYAGQMMDWLTEAALLCTVQLRGRTDHIVMAGADHMRFLRPTVPGEILELRAEISHLGETSIVVQVKGCEMLSGADCCQGEFIFVTVDEAGHKAPHGLG